MDPKAAETTHNINTFRPETAYECTVEWWFKKFNKGNESLEEEECSGQPSEIDNDELRVIVEADPPTTTQEAVEELNTGHSMTIRHLKQIGKVKSSISG